MPPDLDVTSVQVLWRYVLVCIAFEQVEIELVSKVFGWFGAKIDLF